MNRVAFLIAMACISASASAGQFFVADTRLTFSNPSGPGTGWQPYTTILNTSDFGYGADSYFSTGNPVPGESPNTLGAFGSQFVVLEEEQFAVATLAYFNGRTLLGSSAENVVGTASLLFYIPDIGTVSFDYNFSFLFTPNTPGDVDDELTIELLGAPQVFEVEGVSYTLSLQGFRNLFTGEVGNVFVLPEGETAYAELLGTITSNITVIPLPTGAGLAFAGLGLLAVRRRARA